MGDTRFLIVQNDRVENLGLYEVFLRENAIEHQVFHAYNMKPDESFPPTRSYTHFIIGPTPISANDVLEHEYLAKEWAFLGEVVESGKPCLGVCCGGQMLAKLLGAEVRKSPEKEVGGYEVTLTDDGEIDPLFRGFPRRFPVFHWHSDMFHVPDGGQLLVEGEPCPVQAFGWRNVRGVIFHLEIDHREAERWAESYPQELVAVGKTKEQAIQECRMGEPMMRELAYRLMKSFIEFKHEYSD